MLIMPLWKRTIIVLIALWGIAAAMPNLFYAQVEAHNDAQAIADQGGAADSAALAAWPSFLPSSLMNLGLDLRGGAHLLAEVQVADAYAQRMDSLWPEVRDVLRDLRGQTGAIKRVASTPDVLRVEISNAEGMPAALTAVRGLGNAVTTLTGAGQSDLDITSEGKVLVLQLSDAEKSATDVRTLQQSLEIIRRRVDEVGTREPTIQRQGNDRILIQVPGLGSAAELKAIIGTTAKLTFNPVVSITSNASADPGPRNKLVPDLKGDGTYYIIEETPVVGGEDLTDAQPAFDQNGQPAVNFRFNPSGGRAFGDYTGENIGKPFAIVLDDQVISAPTIQAHITGGSGIITGNFTIEESTQLAVLLRAGALPAKMTFLEERTIGPELGADSIAAGRTAAIIGMVAVVVYMIACYGIFGVMANIALAINIALLLAVLSTIGATMTLPGICGYRADHGHGGGC
jgi:preprotein translocase subunit SecD